jgi:ankyrin repeat protein
MIKNIFRKENNMNKLVFLTSLMFISATISFAIPNAQPADLIAAAGSFFGIDYAYLTYLSTGANLNVEDESGLTPLIAAVITGDAQAVQILLTAGADPNYQNRLGQTALLFAYANPDLQAILIQAGAQ